MCNVKDITSRRNTYIMWLYMMTLIIMRLLLVNRIPSCFYTQAGHDDAWVVKGASSILNGNWLGEYSQMTLIKGCFSPLLMAFGNVIGLGYMMLTASLHCISCLIFIKAIAPLLKTCKSKCFAFTLILFDPILFDMNVSQRAYRATHSQWQLLLIFGAMFAIWFHRNDKITKIIPWAVCGGLSLWAFMNTREDSVWIMVFVLIAAVVIILSIILLGKKNKTGKKIVVLKSIVSILPLVLLFVGNSVIKTINYVNYGGYLLNDRTHGYFSEVIKDLYLIEPDEEFNEKYTDPNLPYKQFNYNIYRNAVEKAFNASPSFNSIREKMEVSIANWESAESIVDGELEYDHMVFAIRDAVAMAGNYDNLAESEEFYRIVHKELTDAFENGALSKRNILINTNLPPLPDNSILKVFENIPSAMSYVIDIKELATLCAPSIGSETDIFNFSEITGDNAIFPQEPYIEFSGWAIANDKYGKYSVALCKDDGTVIHNINFVSSEDLHKANFPNADQLSENLGRARFSVRIENVPFDEITLMNFIDSSGNVVGSFRFREANYFDNDFGYCIDSTFISDKTNKNAEVYEKYVNRCNNIIEIYRTIQPFLFCIAVIEWAIILLRAVVMLIKNHKIEEETLSRLIVVSSIFLSLLVFIIAISYVSIAAFPSINALYLSAAYVLTLMFISTSICFGFSELNKLLSNKK